MVIIDQTNNSISVTRGDYAALVFSAYEDDSTTMHELSNGDTVQMQICKNYGTPVKTYTRTKTNSLSTTDDDYTIEIPTGDTKDLKFGEYFYDVSIVDTSGNVCTYIGDDGDIQPRFTVLKEAGGGDE